MKPGKLHTLRQTFRSNPVNYIVNLHLQRPVESNQVIDEFVQWVIEKLNLIQRDSLALAQFNSTVNDMLVNAALLEQVKLFQELTGLDDALTLLVYYAAINLLSHYPAYNYLA